MLTGPHVRAPNHRPLHPLGSLQRVGLQDAGAPEAGVAFVPDDEVIDNGYAEDITGCNQPLGNGEVVW